MQSVVETREYLSDAKKARVTDHQRDTIVDAIATNPRIGDLIQGTGGARKARFAGRGKGKSGGYRVVTYFGGDDIPVFLLALFGKGDKIDLTDTEKIELKRELAGLARDYRHGPHKKRRE